MNELKFPNNIERYSYLKSDWPIVDISSDGNTIYMGKTSRPDAQPEDECWFVKQVVITTEETGNQIVTTKFSENKVRWSDRYSLTYRY